MHECVCLLGGVRGSLNEQNLQVRASHALQQK